MRQIVSYDQQNGIAVITMDDGKVNALSIDMFEALNQSLDRAEEDQAIPIIAGRKGLFSAGFDMKQMRTSPENLHGILRGGADTFVRLLSFPLPTVVACTGHAYPAGAFLMMSCDYRIGASGSFSIGMNEVLINMTIPHFAIELARSRLNPNYFNRTIMTGEMFEPEEAVTAGFLDEVVAPDALINRAMEKAESFKAIAFDHHHATKLRARAPLLKTLETVIERELTLKKAQHSFN